MLEKFKTPKAKEHLKTLLIILAIVLYFIIAYTVGFGLNTHSGVYLADYTVSADGSELTLKIAPDISMGYVRDFEVIKTNGVQYIDFYNTFGGANSKFGAKDEIVVETEDTIGVYFAREDRYELVLYFDSETNEWEIPEKTAEE